MIPFSSFISEAVATRPKKPLKKPSKAAQQRLASTVDIKKKILKQRDEFNRSWGLATTDTNIWYTDVGHDDADPYPNQKELDQIHQQVWGVSKTGRPPELWVASPKVKPSTGMKYVNIRPLINLNHTHAKVYPEISYVGYGSEQSDPYLQGRIDHNRKVISATTMYIRGGSRYSSRTVDAVFAELKKRYPGYSIMDMIDEGKIVPFGRFIREGVRASKAPSKEDTEKKKEAVATRLMGGVMPRKQQWVDIPKETVGGNRILRKSIYDMIDKSYAPMGGHHDFPTPKSVPGDNDEVLAIDTDEDPLPDAVLLMKDTKYGRKLTTIASDGGREAKSQALTKQANILQKDGNYIEASGKLVDIMATRGAPIVSDQGKATTVMQGLGKKIDWKGRHPDGKTGYIGWYERLLGGSPRTKILLGKPRVG